MTIFVADKLWLVTWCSDNNKQSKEERKKNEYSRQNYKSPRIFKQWGYFTVLSQGCLKTWTEHCTKILLILKNGDIMTTILAFLQLREKWILANLERVLKKLACHAHLKFKWIWWVHPFFGTLSLSFKVKCLWYLFENSILTF